MVFSNSNNNIAHNNAEYNSNILITLAPVPHNWIKISVQKSFPEL